MHHVYMHHGYMHHGYMPHGNIIDICIIDSCIIAVEVEKEVLVNFAWVTRPERPKGAKDEVKRPEVPLARSRRLLCLINWPNFVCVCMLESTQHLNSPTTRDKVQ